MSAGNSALDKRRARLRKTMRRDHGNSGFSRRPNRVRPRRNMAPNPAEEGLGRGRGWAGLFGVLAIPKDPRGIVLACAFVGLAALAISTVIAGDRIGFAYLVAAGLGYVYLQTRIVPVTVWLAVGAVGVLSATAGNPGAWIVVGLAGLLAVVALVPPSEVSGRETSRNPEVGSGVPGALAVPNSTRDRETSGVLEVQSGNGHVDPAASEDIAARGDDSPGYGSAASTPTLAEGRPVTRISMRTIGAFAVELDGRDHTQRLHEQPRLEFLLSYLAARAVAAPGAAVDRSLIAEEMAPDISAVSQRDRLRKALHALQSALGADLKGLVRITSTQIRLDLTGVEVDFIALSELRVRIARRRGLIDATLAEEISQLLETASGGEFLTGFEQLEHQVTAGRGGAREVVEQARLSIASWRADLAAALSQHLEAIGRPQASIAFLRSALAQSPEREDLARLLVAAYMQTGQIERAEEVRLDYRLSQGEVR